MLFRKKIQRSCSYCRYGVALDEQSVLCCKKGLKSQTDSCLKFRYDATKRVPAKQKALDFSKFREEDFQL